jgi:single-strand DNA-binding protein
MASFNKVLLIGNITRDPQLRFTATQMAVCDFGIAVNNKYTTRSGEQRDEPCFVDVTAWGKTAELIDQYFTKGKPIFIEGRLKYDTWEDKQGGGKRRKLSVTLETFQFVGDRSTGSNGRGHHDPEDDQEALPSRPAGQRPSKPQQPAGQQPRTGQRPGGTSKLFAAGTEDPGAIFR